jgi:chitinase
MSRIPNTAAQTIFYLYRDNKCHQKIAGGFLAYYEICAKIRSGGWTVVTDPENRMGPYAYKADQWVGFDDIAMIRRKSEFVMANGFGGGMIWALDLDDFANRYDRFTVY